MNIKGILLVMVILSISLNLPMMAKEKSADTQKITKEVKLPDPQTEKGKPLMQALKNRQTIREFDKKDLSPQELSNLLWAADGVNRPDSGKRTAPTAMNCQEIDIYVTKSDGLFFYNASKHALEQITAEDIRGLTGGQPFVKDAPVNLVFVADLSKFKRGDDETKNFYSAMDTGYVSQNVYLYCASEGLATVVRGNVDRNALAKKMNLKQGQQIMVAQTVGYPYKKEEKK